MIKPDCLQLVEVASSAFQLVVLPCSSVACSCVFVYL